MFLPKIGTEADSGQAVDGSAVLCPWDWRRFQCVHSLECRVMSCKLKALGYLSDVWIGTEKRELLCCRWVAGGYGVFF